MAAVLDWGILYSCVPGHDEAVNRQNLTRKCLCLDCISSKRNSCCLLFVWANANSGSFDLTRDSVPFQISRNVLFQKLNWILLTLAKTCWANTTFVSARHVSVCWLVFSAVHNNVSWQRSNRKYPRWRTFASLRESGKEGGRLFWNRKHR